MIRHTKIFAVLALALTTAAAQEISPGKKVPSVSLAPVTVPTIMRGKSGTVRLTFHVGGGFHINSNTPKSDYLIPTSLKLDAPTDIVVGRITYPAGHDTSFPFAPDEKLNVYSGEFTLAVLVRPLSSVLPGKYAFHGTLKYQACDNAACYPPKKTPVDFDVKVTKAPPPPRHNPGQSPHAHR